MIKISGSERTLNSKKQKVNRLKNRRTGLGWMNYSKTFNSYRAVRTSNSGGVQEINFPNNATRSFVLDEAKKLFFSRWKI